MSNAAKAVQSVKLATSNAPVEQTELFELDGKSYTIPKKVRFNLSLKVLAVIDEKGDQAGTFYMLKELLGEENFETLMDFEDLTEETFNQIVELATAVVFDKGPKAP